MFGNIFVQIITYITLIALIHYLYLFFRNNLTTPKIKDLVNKPMENYKQIYQTLNGLKKDEPQDNNQMKNELKNFFKSLNSDEKIETSNDITIARQTNPIASNETYGGGGESMHYSSY